MRILALIWALWRDHFRSKAVIFEFLMVGLFLGLFLNPKDSPFDWQYLALALSWMAIVLSTFITILLAWRNADNKLDMLVIKMGKTSLYFGAFFAFLLIAVFWMAVIALYVYLIILPLLDFAVVLGAPWQLLSGVTANMLIVTALFLLFSPLTGKSVEPYLAVILIIISFGTNCFGEQGQLWQWLEVLLPPLIENIKAASGTSSVPIMRGLAYFTGALALGLVRFARREFIWP